MLNSFFATPVWITDCDSVTQGRIHDEIDRALDPDRIQNRPWEDLVKSTFTYEGTDDFARFSLKRLQSFIEQNVKAYAQSLGARQDLGLMESWFNRYDQGDFQFDHCHANRAVSGVYYYQAEPGQGDLRLITPNHAQWLSLWPADTVSSQGVQIPAVTGRLVLFPGWLTHRVCPNAVNSDRPRISVSFNYQ